MANLGDLGNGRGYAQVDHGKSYGREIRRKDLTELQAGSNHVHTSTESSIKSLGSVQRAEYSVLPSSTRFQALFLDIWRQVCDKKPLISYIH